VDMHGNDPLLLSGFSYDAVGELLRVEKNTCTRPENQSVVGERLS
jgi:hypothetical protein